MQCTCASAILAVLACNGLVTATEANSLGKVIGLMDSLTAKISKEGEDKAKAYKDFFEWCDDAARNGAMTQRRITGPLHLSAP